MSSNIKPVSQSKSSKPLNPVLILKDKYKTKDKKTNKSKNSNNHSMSYLLSVLTHPSSDISKPSLMIEDQSTGDRIIIGNVPAGLQRKCNEMKARTSRLTNIFLSGILDWESIAGLPGLILTVSDQGVKYLNLYHSGNKLIQYMISSWRYFLFRFGLDLKAQDIEIPVNKSNIAYTPINISSDLDYGSNDNKEEAHSKLEIIMKHIFPIQEKSSRPAPKKISNITLPFSIINPKVSVNWLITPNSTRGKFLVNVAKELGCKPPQYRDLCNYKSVTLEDGTIISPDQVLQPSRNINPLLILDIPSKDYLNNTLQYNWKQHLKTDLPYSAVFHFIDDSITDPLSDPKYINFIQSFGPKTTHFISHKSYCPNSLNFGKTFNISIKWKTLLPNFFPLPKWSTNSDLKIDNSILPNVLPLISGQSLSLRSTIGTEIVKSTEKGSEIAQFTLENAKSLYQDKLQDECIKNNISKESFDKMLDINENTPSLRKTLDPTKSLKDQVETLILGTGSALPSTLRNVLCNIIRIPFNKKDDKNGKKSGFRSIVLDAGENSFGSLRRLYQPEEVNMILDEMSIIYLSHLHADHHLGIIDFIKEWNSRQIEKYGDNREDILYLITPWQYDFFMDELNHVDEFIDKRFIQPISCDEFMYGYISPSFERYNIDTIPTDDLENISFKEIEYKKNCDVTNNLYDKLGIESISTCSAFHCDFSYSVSMSFKLDTSLYNDMDESNIFKISYSGDTRPKGTFSFIGEKSDLLIHESTLEDEKFKDAVDKRHSTTSEAVQVGILMKAKKIILTHFSQRYKSFTCSDIVYKRLSNPVTLKDLIENGEYFPSPTSSPDSNKSSKTQFVDDTNIPLEAKSNIFAQEMPIFARINAANIEILFAFDNMKVEYSEMGFQKKIFEVQHQTLEKLFPEYQEDKNENFIESEAETTTDSSSKTTRKQSSENDDIQKKQKLSP